MYAVIKYIGSLINVVAPIPYSVTRKENPKANRLDFVPVLPLRIPRILDFVAAMTCLMQGSAYNGNATCSAGESITQGGDRVTNSQLLSAASPGLAR